MAKRTIKQIQTARQARFEADQADLRELELLQVEPLTAITAAWENPAVLEAIAITEANIEKLTDNRASQAVNLVTFYSGGINSLKAELARITQTA